ncbi:MAG: hypothetical protein GY946_17790, partial [bacterium]|nr:hypothetical protein [bacterium]
MRIEPLFSEEQIQERVRELADRLARDYFDLPLTVICIAEGARRFVDDLLRQLARCGVEPERLDVRAQRTEGTTLGPVQVDHFDPEGLEGRDVLVADDIADEGATLRAVLEIVSLGEPRSVCTAVLIDKRERRTESVSIDYAAFELEA